MAPTLWNPTSDVTAYANVECWGGQTDKEYNAAEERRRGNLRDDSCSDANYFFWAAGLAAIGSGLFPVRLNILVSIGAFDLLGLYGKSLGRVAVGTAVAIWLIAIVAVGFAARLAAQGKMLDAMGVRPELVNRKTGWQRATGKRWN